jgi:hypothetical protein
MQEIRETKSVPPIPKRGAFPTPRSEIEGATPYVTESDLADDQPGTQPVSPTNADQDRGG